MNKILKLDNNIDIVAVEPLNNKQDKILEVNWFMHRRCNFDCSYCPPYIHDNFSKVISFEQVVKTLTVFSKRLKDIGKEKINWALTGGEPLINPDIIKILKYIRNDEITKKIIVTSNGSRNYKKLKEIMFYLDNLTISLHLEKGLDHNFKLIEKIDKLTNDYQNKFITFTIVVPAGFLEDVKKIKIMLEQKNLKHSFRAIKPTFDYDLNLIKSGHKWFKNKKNVEIDKNFSNLVNTKRFQENEKFRLEYYSKEENDFLISTERVHDFHNMIFFTRNKNSHKIHSDHLYANYMSKFKGWHCFGGIDHCAIRENGDVWRTVCQNASPLGNINTGFSFVDAPMICQKETCVALPDITCRKNKPGFEELVK